MLSKGDYVQVNDGRGGTIRTIYYNKDGSITGNSNLVIVMKDNSCMLTTANNIKGWEEDK